MPDNVKNIEEGAEKAAKKPAKKAAAEKLQAARAKVSEIAGGVEKRAEKVKSGAGKAAQQVRDSAGRAGEAARERFDVARESVRHGYDRVTKDLDQLSKDVTEYVRHNPGKAVAIAAGVGFLIGILVRGRRD